MIDRAPSSAGAPSGVRLQKLLADAGLGSRRALEKRIASGEVSINGEVAELGQQAAKGDVVQLDGRRWEVIAETPEHRSLVYNKPLGEVTTRSDPQGRPTVFDDLPPVRDGRWIAVGRLDINTTGLLLMTTDGELANAMMHPSSTVDREYVCRVLGPVDDDMLERLKTGVELDDGPACFSDIVEAGGSGENRWFHVTLLEGRNREVRRLWQSQGVTVSRLKRVRYGAVFLPKGLRMGRYAELTASDHAVMREDVGLPARQPMLALRSAKESRPGARGRQRPTKRKGRRRRRS